MTPKLEVWLQQIPDTKLEVSMQKSEVLGTIKILRRNLEEDLSLRNAHNGRLFIYNSFLFILSSFIDTLAWKCEWCSWLLNDLNGPVCENEHQTTDF